VLEEEEVVEKDNFEVDGSDYDSEENELDEELEAEIEALEEEEDSDVGQMEDIGQYDNNKKGKKRPRVELEYEDELQPAKKMQKVVDF
jgi:hypothetical protein